MRGSQDGSEPREDVAEVAADQAQLAGQDIKLLREDFAAMDLDGNGFLDQTELIRAMEMDGRPVEQE